MINVAMLLENAHTVLLDTVDGLSTTDWSRPSTYGALTSREILAHLTQVELVLVDLVRPSRPLTPLLIAFCTDRPTFNKYSVDELAGRSLVTLFSEYELAHETLLASLSHLSLDADVPHPGLRRYGRSVADCLIALGYGYKLIHAAQIDTYRQLQSGRSPTNASTGWRHKAEPFP